MLFVLQIICQPHLVVIAELYLAQHIGFFENFCNTTVALPTGGGGTDHGKK